MTTRPTPPLFKRVLQPLQRFFQFEAAGGVMLLAATIVAMVWANSGLGDLYVRMVELPITVSLGGARSTFTLHALVNDGLMAIFFFVVGMEIKRELVVGELKSVQRAMLPAFAAVGGMLLPAAIYSAFNWGTPAMAGWAIPMATDIAFAIGVMTLLKDRVPWGLIVFLTALAIFDDMGGILVIALFYGTGIHLDWLLISALVMAGLIALGRMHVTSGLVYALGGVVLWYCVHHAGIHATIAGVLLGLTVPARSRTAGAEVIRQLHRYLSELNERKGSDENVTNEEVVQIEERLEELEPPLNRFVHLLHPYVSFCIVPVFALVNAGVDLRGVPLSALLGPVPLGIALGLLVGKTVGIFLFTWVVVRMRWAPMPGGGSAPQLAGVAVVAGIGFTVALFIASLAFASDPTTLAQAKLGILTGSLASAVIGYVALRIMKPPLPTPASPAAGSPAATLS